MLSPVTSASAAASYPDDGPVLPVSVFGGIPVRESQLGHGAALEAGIPESIDLGGGAELAHSALVRLSAFRVDTQTTLSVSGAPALVVATDRSASTTVLVPVRNGALTLTSSTDSDVRVDVLALFSGDRSAPGRHGCAGFGSDPTGRHREFGLARGRSASSNRLGRPRRRPREWGSCGARQPHGDRRTGCDAVYRRAEPPGRGGNSTLSTIVRPSLSGDVEVTSDAAISVRVDIRGYVAEAGDYPTALNGPGSYWSQPAEQVSRFAVDDKKPVPVPLSTNRDAAYAIALVWAGPADDLTLSNLVRTTAWTGARRSGRRSRRRTAAAGRGADGEDPSLKLRRGATDARVLELGALLGDTQQGAREIAIRVDSPGRAFSISATG